MHHTQRNPDPLRSVCPCKRILPMHPVVSTSWARFANQSRHTHVVKAVTTASRERVRRRSLIHANNADEVVGANDLQLRHGLNTYPKGMVTAGLHKAKAEWLRWVMKHRNGRGPTHGATAATTATRPPKSQRPPRPQPYKDNDTIASK